MKRVIVITYKNGTSINLDVPELYYQEKCSKKASQTPHKMLIKEYSKFVSALNRSSDGVVQVGKYLKFSNATVSRKDILSLDIKDLEVEYKPLDNTIFIPGIHDKVYLDLTDTRLEAILDKLESLNVLENLNKFIQAFTDNTQSKNELKEVEKKSTTSKKKKKVTVESVEDNTIIIN